jgi:predicted transglutaminase-like cysteine proteinase
MAMVEVLRQMASMALFSLITFAPLNVKADSNASMFPGWNAVASTNWDVKTPAIQNWRQMLARWADGKDCDNDTCSSANWAAMVANVKATGDVMAQMKKANSLINDPSQHLSKEDSANWKTDEYWKTPYEFLKKSGDAQDFAIAKYFLLKAAGVPVADMQIILVRLKSQGGIGHAILAVRPDATRIFILDNRVLQVLTADLLKDEFTPVLGINESAWCAYVAQQ